MIVPLNTDVSVEMEPSPNVEELGVVTVITGAVISLFAVNSVSPVRFLY